MRQIGSTNDEAKRLARAAAEEGTLVWGLEQTAGRGRRGRAWSSPPGNLYASLILRPTLPFGSGGAARFRRGVGRRRRSELDLRNRLDGLSYKWPNDVLLRGRKIAGILLESELQSDGKHAAVRRRRCRRQSHLIAARHGVSGHIDCRRGSRDVSPAAALEGFARHFQAWAERWREDGFAPVRAAWRARAAALGEPIRVRLEAATLHGRFLDIDQHGALLLETAGQLRRISAGEIFPANR